MTKQVLLGLIWLFAFVSAFSHFSDETFFFFFFWLHCAAFGILVPQQGIEPAPPAVEAQSLNHWTTREVPN